MRPLFPNLSPQLLMNTSSFSYLTDGFPSSAWHGFQNFKDGCDREGLGSVSRALTPCDPGGIGDLHLRLCLSRNRSVADFDHTALASWLAKRLWLRSRQSRVADHIYKVQVFPIYLSNPSFYSSPWKRGGGIGGLLLERGWGRF